MPDRSRFVRNTAYQYALQAAKYLFPFITVAYLTRTLGPDVYAVRAYVHAAMSFMLVFLDFGFQPYGTGAIARTEGDRAAENRETSAIMSLRLLLCLAGGAALVPLTAAIPLLAAHPVYVAIAYAGTCLKALLPDFVFQGHEDMGILTVRFVVSQTVAVALIFLLVHGPQDLLAVPAIEGIASAIALAWTWASALRTQGVRLARPAPGSFARCWPTRRCSSWLPHRPPSSRP